MPGQQHRTTRLICPSFSTFCRPFLYALSPMVSTSAERITIVATSLSAPTPALPSASTSPMITAQAVPSPLALRSMATRAAQAYAGIQATIARKMERSSATTRTQTSLSSPLWPSMLAVRHHEYTHAQQQTTRATPAKLRRLLPPRARTYTHTCTYLVHTHTHMDTDTRSPPMAHPVTFLLCLPHYMRSRRGTVK